MNILERQMKNDKAHLIFAHCFVNLEWRGFEIDIPG